MNDRDTVATQQSHQAMNGHEKTDARPGLIFAIVLYLSIAGVAIHFLLAGILGHLELQRFPRDQWSRIDSRSVEPLSSSSNFPRLQINPPLDLKRFREHEDSVLTNYGWVNQGAGIVRLPVARAIELLLQKGLPIQTNAPPASDKTSSWDLEQERASHANQRINSK